MIERQILAEFLEFAGLLVGELAHRFARLIDRVLRADHVGDRGVVLRLGVVDVGDRGEADLEALLRLLELAIEGLLVRVGEFQRVERGQHAEIRLRAC